MRDNTLAPMEMKQLTPDVLMRLSIAFTSDSKFSQNLEKALELIGKISHHDRIYIVEIHRNLTYTITYNWHEKPLKAIPEEFRHNGLIYDKELEQQLCSQNQVIIQETDGTDKPELAAVLKATDCRQMLLLPLFESGSQFAFIAFTQCSATHPWTPEEIKCLQDLSSVIALQLDNHQLIKRLTLHLRQERAARLELGIRVQHQLSQLRAGRVIRRQNEQLKKSLEARDKLYSVIAHDLRAPIGTIKMINFSIEAQKAKIQDPQISKLFGMINETTEEAFNLLENLLRWTRNQNGQTKVYATPFNLAPVVRQVVSLFSAIADAKGIALINRIEGRYDIFADEDMIKTVLRNLISNAIKFTYTGGEVEVSLSDTGDCRTIYVKDNGKGIPKDLQPHLLKSDEYITTCGTHNEKGSGLGLILCRDLIRMNKGKLYFCSQEGIGSTFYFTIPKAPSSAEAASR